MHVTELHIENFRRFQKLDFYPPKDLAVLIGVNGSGKSTVLDALAILLNLYSNQLLGRKYWHDDFFDIEFTDSDISLATLEARLAVTVQVDKLNLQSWNILINRSSYPTRRNKNKGNKVDNNQLFDLVRSHLNQLKYSPSAPSPILMHYQHSRTATNSSSVEHYPSFGKRGIPKLSAYLQAFSKNRDDFKDFFDWFELEENYENEVRLREDINFKNSRLEVVRLAIQTFLAEFPDAHFDNLRIIRHQRNSEVEFKSRSIEPTLVITKNAQEFSINQLSDGEKTLLMLVADIARRLAILNPGASSPEEVLKGNGIVLIDEIDLHLHPAWQRMVIPGLRATFPNCQFFATTHSPQVLSNVPKENVFILEDSQIYPADSTTYGRDTNAILAELMGVSERPLETKKMLNECFNLIDAGELQKAEIRLDELEKMLGSFDTEVIRAKTLLGFLSRKGNEANL
jgi:predicted ATP-binding protein involved in virulence